MLDNFWFQLGFLALVIAVATLTGGRLAFSYRESFNMLIDPGAFAEEGQSRAEFGMGLLLTLLGMLVFGGVISVLTNQLLRFQEDMKLRQVHATLGEAFETQAALYTRRVLEEHALSARARWFDVDVLELELGIPQADMTSASSAFNGFRLRKLEHGQIVVEETVQNRSYGTRVERDGGTLWVSTQSATDPALGHFVRTLAANTEGSVVSNERYSLSHPLGDRHVRFSSGEAWRDLSPQEPEALRDFGDDLRALSADAELVIYVSSSNTRWTQDVHLMCGRNDAELAEGSSEDCANVPGFDFLVQTVTERLAPYDLRVGTTEELHLDSPDHLVNALRRVQGAPVLVVFVSTDILWSDDEVLYYRTLAALRDAVEALSPGAD